MSNFSKYLCLIKINSTRPSWEKSLRKRSFSFQINLRLKFLTRNFHFIRIHSTAFGVQRRSLGNSKDRGAIVNFIEGKEAQQAHAGSRALAQLTVQPLNLALENNYPEVN